MNVEIKEINQSSNFYILCSGILISGLIVFIMRLKFPNITHVGALLLLLFVIFGMSLIGTFIYFLAKKSNLETFEILSDHQLEQAFEIKHEQFLENKQLLSRQVSKLSHQQAVEIQKIAKDISELRVILEKYLRQEEGLIVVSAPGGPTLIDEEDQKIFATPLANLDLSVRSYNALTYGGNIRSLGELATKKPKELLKIKNFGRKSLVEIEKVLIEKDLALGMKFDVQKEKE